MMTSLYVDDKDRVVTILARSKHSENKVFFFWRGRDLFFAHAFREGESCWLYCSWEGKQVIDVQMYQNLEGADVFESLGYGNEFLHHGDLDIEHYLDNEDIYKSSEKIIKKEKRKNKSLYQKLEKDLKKLEKGLELSQFTNEDLTALNEIGEGRYKIKFYGVEGHFKKRDMLFKKLKQWRESKNIIESRLSKTKDKVIKKVENNKLCVKIISPVWVVKKEKSSINKNEKYVSISYKSYTCFLGRNSTENDYIRNKVANKSDIWVHLDNQNSGHLFIRGGKPDLEEMTVLTSALVDICNIDIKQMNIIFTLVSNLKGLKGARGAVIFKKEKRLTLYFDQEWRQKITSIDEQ